MPVRLGQPPPQDEETTCEKAVAVFFCIFSSVATIGVMALFIWTLNSA
jgi:hypothetical protein